MFRRRSSVTGKFVTPAAAAADPAGTVTETARPSLKVPASALCSVLVETGDIDRLSAASTAAYYDLMAHLANG